MDEYDEGEERGYGLEYGDEEGEGEFGFGYEDEGEREFEYGEEEGGEGEFGYGDEGEDEHRGGAGAIQAPRSSFDGREGAARMGHSDWNQISVGTEWEVQLLARGEQDVYDALVPQLGDYSEHQLNQVQKENVKQLLRSRAFAPLTQWRASTLLKAAILQVRLRRTPLTAATFHEELRTLGWTAERGVDTLEQVSILRYLRHVHPGGEEKTCGKGKRKGKRKREE